MSAQLAAHVAEGLGIPVPPALSRALERPARPEVTVSPALSLTALPGDGGIRTRKIAILAAHGVMGESIAALRATLTAAGAVTCVIAPRLGAVETADGVPLAAAFSLENSAPVLFDAVVLPDGAAGVTMLARHAQAMDFITNQYRHGKTLLALGASRTLLEMAGIAPRLASGEVNPGVLLSNGADSAEAFIEAVATHRHPARASDPPRV